MSKMTEILLSLRLIVQGVTRLVRAHTAKTTIDRRVDRPAFILKKDAR